MEPMKAFAIGACRSRPYSFIPKPRLDHPMRLTFSTAGSRLFNRSVCSFPQSSSKEKILITHGVRAPITHHRRSVLMIGSGPIIIGQAAEFDYAGVQACRALREEGCRVVLVNSNPATIMTDTEVADAVYLEPLTVTSVEAIIARERPEALLPTLGGQTGLNLAVELSESGVLDRYGVRLLGTPVTTIKLAEDREKFKEGMLAIGEPVPASIIVTDVESGVAFAAERGYPLVIRPAYTLGGTGGGIVSSETELRETLQRGLEASIIHQALVETSLLGWKEIEYEVIRDRADNC